MSLDELRNLKKELEQNRIEEKHIIVGDLSCQYNVSNPKSKEEIQSLVDTNKAVEDIEKTFKSIIIYLTKQNIPFDQIEINGSLGLICTESYIKRLKQTWKSIRGIITPNEWKPILHQTIEQASEFVFPNIIPINYSISTIYTTYKEHELGNLLPNTIEADEKLKKFQMSGIVKYEEFTKKMKNNGYEITIGNNNKIYSYEDYLNEIMNNWNEIFHVRADFGKKKTLKK